MIQRKTKQKWTMSKSKDYGKQTQQTVCSQLFTTAGTETLSKLTLPSAYYSTTKTAGEK